MSTSQDKELKRIMDSTDPCAVHVRGYICTVPATETKAEHTAIKIECLLCKRPFAWSSWVRVRGHLSGDGTMALAAGTTACLKVPSELAEQFKSIVAAAMDAKRVRGAEARGRAAVNAACGGGGGGGGGGGAGAGGGAGGGAAASSSSTMKRQKPIQSAFETQGESAVSEAVANFFFGCDIPLAVADSAFFRRMVGALKVASVAYKPPHRVALSDKYVDIVETRVNAASRGADRQLRAEGRDDPEADPPKYCQCQEFHSGGRGQGRWLHGRELRLVRSRGSGRGRQCYASPERHFR